MNRLFSALILLTATGVGIAGCSGDDDDNNGGGGGTGGTSSASAGEPAVTAGQPSGTGGSPDSGNPSCDPSENGVCQNDTDCPSVSSGEARMAAGTCGLGCLGSSDADCASSCIVDETHMTSECATCYADAVACATKECRTPCVQDGPESDACKQCQVDKGCRAAFNECSGLSD